MVNKHGRNPFIYAFCFCILLIAFTIYKIRFLPFPFYWDEAWSYATSIYNLNRSGISIIPLNLNAEVMRGHPFVFYYISVLWVKLTGGQVVSMHLYALLISLSLLISLYYIFARIFNSAIAFIALLVFMLQSMFLAQSTMLLPEILLSLFSIWTVYFFIQKKWVLYLISGALLVLTKESGLVLIITLFVYSLFPFRKSLEKQRFLHLLKTGLPLVFFACYLILLKFKYGWYIFPEHKDFVILTPGIIAQNYLQISNLFFIENGRYILLFMLIFSIIVSVIKKETKKLNDPFLAISIVFLLFFIGFSSMFFFTPRYLTCILPFYILVSISSLFQIIHNLKKYLIIMALFIYSGYYTFFRNINENDTSIGYFHSTIVQKNAVRFLEKYHLQDKQIYSTFLMQYYMSIPELGYLENSSDPFVNVSNKKDKDYDLFIFCSNEYDAYYKVIADNSSRKLIRRYQDGKAWVEIYQNVQKPSSF